MSEKVLIIGAYGLLGSALSKYLINKGLIVLKAGTKASSDYVVNASSKKNLDRLLSKTKPNYVINLCAITDVDYCESNIKKAFIINSEVPKNISMFINKYAFKFIHISTDQVYEGKGPHKEQNTNPINIYSKSKLAGEKFVLKSKGIVLRTNFVGRSLISSRKSFTDWLVSSATKNINNLNLFDDIIFNPLHIEDLNIIIHKVLNEFKPGCYNIGSQDSLSKAQFGLTFLKKLGFSTNKIKVISIKNSELIAKRPLDMSMNVEKFKRVFKLQIPKMNKTINKCVLDYQL